MNYTTSRDYDLLIRLMQSGHRLVCFVNYRFPSDKPGEPPCRDVCRTRYEPPMPGKNPEEHYFAAQCRGVCYAGGCYMTAAEFKNNCQAVELKFILPTLTEDEPWCNPDETHPIPSWAKKWAAIAASEICQALSARNDTPSEFARHINNAHRALGSSYNHLVTGWPNAECTNPEGCQ